MTAKHKESAALGEMNLEDETYGLTAKANRGRTSSQNHKNTREREESALDEYIRTRRIARKRTKQKHEENCLKKESKYQWVTPKPEKNVHPSWNTPYLMQTHATNVTTNGREPYVIKPGQQLVDYSSSSESDFGEFWHPPWSDIDERMDDSTVATALPNIKKNKLQSQDKEYDPMGELPELNSIATPVKQAQTKKKSMIS